MSPPTDRLPPSFARLGWSNLAAQLSEQIALAAAPLVAEAAKQLNTDRANLYRRMRRLGIER